MALCQIVGEAVGRLFVRCRNFPRSTRGLPNDIDPGIKEVMALAVNHSGLWSFPVAQIDIGQHSFG